MVLGRETANLYETLANLDLGFLPGRLTWAPGGWRTWRRRGIRYTGYRSESKGRTCAPASGAGRSRSSAPSAASWGAAPGLAAGSRAPHPTPRPSPACQSERMYASYRRAICVRDAPNHDAAWRLSSPSCKPECKINSVVIRTVTDGQEKSAAVKIKKNIIHMIIGFNEGSSKLWFMLTSCDTRFFALTLWCSRDFFEPISGPRMPWVVRYSRTPNLP